MASKWRFVCIVPVAVFAGSGGPLTTGPGRESWPDREHAYRALATHPHPAWRELWDGRIGPGDSVEELIARTQPLYVERAGRFVRLSYNPPGRGHGGLNVVARDGRLAFAGASDCIWGHTFFNALSAADWQEFIDAEDAQRAAAAGQ